MSRPSGDHGTPPRGLTLSPDLLGMRWMWQCVTVCRAGTGREEGRVVSRPRLLCRPFDDQMVRRIRRETEAFESILEKIEAKEAAFISSEILVFEVQRIIAPDKRAKVSSYLGLHQGYHVTTSETLAVANEIILKFKLAPRDALHSASAALGKAQYFPSCDDGITRRFKTRPLSVNIRKKDRTVEVMNPADFIAKIGW